MSFTQVREKLATLVNVRRHKMEDGLGQIAGTATVRVNGLGAYELNLMRTNFQGAMNMFLKLETVSNSSMGTGYECAALVICECVQSRALSVKLAWALAVCDYVELCVCCRSSSSLHVWSSRLQWRRA